MPHPDERAPIHDVALEKYQEMMHRNPLSELSFDDKLMRDLLREIKGLRRDMQIRDLMQRDPEFRALVARHGLPVTLF